MKKILLIVLPLIFISLALTGCSSNSTSADNKVPSKTKIEGIGTITKDKSLYKSLPSRIKESNEIVNGIDDSYPPMVFRDDNNNLVGFDIDIGRALEAKLGVKIKNVPTDWSGIIPSLQAKKFDMVLSAMGITDERKKEVSFSKPYFIGGVTIISNKDDRNMKSVKDGSDLKGKIVGVQLGSQAIIDYIEKIRGIKKIKKYDKTTEALQDLTNNRIDAVVDDFQVGSYYIQKVPGKYQKVDQSIDEPYGIAFRKNDKQLQKTVQKAIDELKKDGTLSKISKKWFETDIYKNDF
ncbi:transporter substrate-binding domain-containing protein [Heyndrickxia faecalis]|uniref:ABC transporter substrate-binding protein n=1 Tax=Heyndrickxia faecalis TaxID=2824910 RepID=UPI003D1CB430